MSVGALLGLDDDHDGLLAEAACAWPVWCRGYPALSVAPDPGGLRPWLSAAPSERADEALHALACLAAEDGGNERAAAAVLAWALLPGACRLARRLHRGCPPLTRVAATADEAVAAHLWLQVRTFPWRHRRRVAGNILREVNCGVLRDWGIHSQARRLDRTWAATSVGLREDTDHVATTPQPGREPTAWEELVDVLEWATDRRIITEANRRVLLSLVTTATAQQVTHRGRGAAGLLGNDVVAVVASQLGLSVPGVKRRARRSLNALAAAAAGYESLVNERGLYCSRIPA